MNLIINMLESITSNSEDIESISPNIGDSDNDNENNESDNENNDDELETTKGPTESVSAKIGSSEKKVTFQKTKSKTKSSKLPKRCSLSVKKILIIIIVFTIVNILNICAIAIGVANYYDDEGVCQEIYEPEAEKTILPSAFPLSEWLVIVGCMGTSMTVGTIIVALISKSLKRSNIVQSILFLPEFALWIYGSVILYNLKDDSCHDDFYKVWSMSVAWCVLRGLGFLLWFFSLCWYAAG